jgi:hypothetical protein
VQSGDRTYPAYHGNGNGSQLLLVVPQFDLAVMFTAGNYRQGCGTMSATTSSVT